MSVPFFALFVVPLAGGSRSKASAAMAARTMLADMSQAALDALNGVVRMSRTLFFMPGCASSMVGANQRHSHEYRSEALLGACSLFRASRNNGEGVPFDA